MKRSCQHHGYACEEGSCDNEAEYELRTVFLHPIIVCRDHVRLWLGLAEKGHRPVRLKREHHHEIGGEG